MRRMSECDPGSLLSETSESETSAYLRGPARRLTAAYVAHWPVRAVLLIGSAVGVSDHYSDVGRLVYCDEPPSVAGETRYRSDPRAVSFCHL
jgi:hypothetical protein